MRASRKKPLLFAVIVVVGTALVLLDVPLPWLVPLLILVGFVNLLALGSLTPAEIRAALPGGTTESHGTAGPRQPAGKSSERPADTRKAAVPGADKKGGKKPAGNGSGAAPGPSTHPSTLVSAVRSLGSLYRDTGSREKKVEDIDRLLDKTISERVSAPPRTGTAKAGGGKRADPGDPAPGSGSGGGLPERTARDNGPAASPPVPGASAPDQGSAAGGPELPPVPGGMPAAGGIPEDTGGDPGVFSGRDGSTRSRADTGDVGTQGPGGADRGGTQATPDTMAGPATGAGAEHTAVKTIRVPSDAPDDAGGTGDDARTDTEAIARGASGGEDLFRTIASDAKDVRNVQDTSLLRDLKDFRAPAAEIERELEDLSGHLNLARQKTKKDPPASRERK